MSKKRITQAEIPAILYRLGVNYFATATFTAGSAADPKKYFGFKADRISAELRDQILAVLPQAEFFIAQAEYAPEQKRSLIAFPRLTKLYTIQA